MSNKSFGEIFPVSAQNRTLIQKTDQFEVKNLTTNYMTGPVIPFGWKKDGNQGNCKLIRFEMLLGVKNMPTDWFW